MQIGWSVEVDTYLVLRNNWYVKDPSGTPMAVLTRNGRWVKEVHPITLTGLFAGPRYWFRSMERRIEIATKRLMAEAARIEEREQRAAQLRWRAQVAARRTQGKG